MLLDRIESISVRFRRRPVRRPKPITATDRDRPPVRPNPGDITDALPPNVALVEFARYFAHPPRAAVMQRLITSLSDEQPVVALVLKALLGGAGVADVLVADVPAVAARQLRPMVEAEDEQQLRIAALRFTADWLANDDTAEDASLATNGLAGELRRLAGILAGDPACTAHLPAVSAVDRECIAFSDALAVAKTWGGRATADLLASFRELRCRLTDGIEIGVAQHVVRRWLDDFGQVLSAAPWLNEEVDAQIMARWSRFRCAVRDVLGPLTTDRPDAPPASDRDAPTATDRPDAPPASDRDAPTATDRPAPPTSAPRDGSEPAERPAAASSSHLDSMFAALEQYAIAGLRLARERIGRQFET